MKTQTRISIFLSAALAALGCHASSIYSSGDTSVHFLGGLVLAHENNIYRQSALKVSDLRAEFIAGVEFQMSPRGAAETSLTLTERFVRYNTEPLDDEFFEANFTTSYDSGVVMSNLRAYYKEDYSTRVDFENVTDAFGYPVTRQRYGAGGSFKYRVSELTAIKAGVDYSEVSYNSITINGQTIDPYTGYETISIPVTGFYKISPKVDLTAGVRYRQTDAENGISYDDTYYFVGAVGELFSPVIYADVSIGYQKRDGSRSIDDQNSSSYSLSFIYTGNPKGTAYFTLARDFRTSAVNGVSYVYDSATLGGEYSMSQTVRLHGALVYATSDYETINREDDIKLVRLGASYRPNDYLTLDASYILHDVDSDLVNYSDNEIRVSASLRY